MNESKHSYRSKTVRAPNTRVRLTDRDRAIIRAVYDYRFLTLPQLQTLLFHTLKAELPGLGERPHTRATQDLSWPQRVLARLFHAGYLNRVFLPVLNSPAIYTLDLAGIDLLKREFGIERPQYGWKAWRPSAKTLQGEFFQHALAINTFRILLTRACEAVRYTLAQVFTENELKVDIDRVQVKDEWGRVKSIPVIPDSYFLVKTPRGVAHFFLELDRATMAVSRFQTKIRGYLAYHQNGGFTARYSASKFRVLTVTSADTPEQSDKRALKLKDATADIGGRSLFWFAPLHSLMPQNMLHEDIWLLAGEDTPTHLFNP
jgi:hypothetical protein